MSGEMHARAELIKGFQIALYDGAAHRVVVDLPPELGTGLGPTSLQLCVMSHAGCYATICVYTAKRMRLPLKGLTVKVEAVETDEAGTITEENFDIHIKANAPEDRIQRLHELTVKNCPVGILLEKASVKINYNLKTSKE
ncbi:OsmC family protein [Candidatus Bathyarchaeota archaeon A05DMB-2]|nr:OsmC family protein [Candidatus Bathyarchaeota archaeon A05DMB-2]